MIDKPTIIITSLGRTGTTFFASLFGKIIPDADSFHEPDVYQFYSNDRWGDFVERVENAGFTNMVIKKLLGKWSMIRLSDMRITGKLTYDQAVKEATKYRYDFVRTKKGSVYVESNASYYGLVDVLNGVFSQHKTIYLVRDGREWITSTLKVGEIYTNRGIRDLIAHQMPTAAQVPGDPYASSWENSSRFFKLCWAWKTINGYAISMMEKNPNARLVKFEDIFTGDQKYQKLDELVEFATDMPMLKNIKLGTTQGWLETKINQSDNNAGSWQNWTREEKQQFDTICGPLMEKIGYSN